MNEHKVCVWTQTYSDQRSNVFDWRVKDEYFKYFISQFEDSILTFHNCSENYAKNIIENYNCYRKSFLLNGITYQESLNYVMNWVKDQKYDKILFMQDDCFSVQRDFEYYKQLADYIKTSNYKMINLMYESGEKITNKGENILNDAVIHKTTNFDLVHSKICDWYFDDSPYVADIDMALSIYDANYLSFANIWDGEKYLNRKMSLLEIPRYILNKVSFRNVNFVGMNDWNKENEIKWLKENFDN